MLYFFENKKEQSTFCRLLFCILGSWYFCFPNLSAQSIEQTKISELTVGYTLVAEELPEGYNYAPLFFTARLPVFQLPTKKKANFYVFAEPQFVLNNAPKAFPNTIEFGVNLGIQYFLPFSKKNGLAASISAGPHYLSLETAIQAKGFIFSDNIEIGYYQLLDKQWGFTIKPRFRHISNAGFLTPNIGIDNLFLMVGIFWQKSD